MFKFKQFEVKQNQSAMKVGTDAVLLGSWVKYDNPLSILDIGSGTGVISLMMAQRFNNSDITAIEIDKEAFIESNINFKNSKWNNRLNCIHDALQTYKFSQKFDLIISNPPYFKSTTPSKSESRKIARHENCLKMEELLFYSSKLLKSDGIIAIIIPYERFLDIKTYIIQENLFLKRICKIKGNKKAHIKRIMLEISKNENETISEQLIIEEDRHQYTKEYKRLCKEFYLNF